MVTELATNPRGYFAERIKYPQLRRQVGIVLLAGLVANLWQLGLLAGLGASSDYIADVLLILTGVGLLEYLAVWLVLTIVMSLVAGLLGGDSSTGRLLRLTGYGFVPLIVSGIVWSVGHYLTYTGVGAPNPPEAASFYSRYQTYTEFLARGSGDLVLYGSIVVGSVFVLLAGYLWYQAIATATELERDRAAIPAVVATGLAFVWVFFSVV